MKIEQCFPLECCEKCKSVRPYTDQQRLFADCEVVEQIITIGFEHEQQCVAIYKMLEERYRSDHHFSSRN